MERHRFNQGLLISQIVFKAYFKQIPTPRKYNFLWQRKSAILIQKLMKFWKTAAIVYSTVWALTTDFEDQQWCIQSFDLYIQSSPQQINMGKTNFEKLYNISSADQWLLKNHFFSKIIRILIEKWAEHTKLTKIEKQAIFVCTSHTEIVLKSQYVSEQPRNSNFKSFRSRISKNLSLKKILLYS